MLKVVVPLGWLSEYIVVNLSNDLSLNRNVFLILLILPCIILCCLIRLKLNMIHIWACRRIIKALLLDLTDINSCVLDSWVWRSRLFLRLRLLSAIQRVLEACICLCTYVCEIEDFCCMFLLCNSLSLRLIYTLLIRRGDIAESLPVRQRHLRTQTSYSHVSILLMLI